MVVPDADVISPGAGRFANRPYETGGAMPTYDPDRHHRSSIRLRGYDYAQAGVYFVTICVQGRECLFGEVRNGRMVENSLGRIVANTWEWLESNYPSLQLDQFVVMPKHLHGLLILNGDPAVVGGGKPKTLGRIIGAFKTVSTKDINALRDTPGARLWQRDFYDYIIRHDRTLDKIREYIFNNPASWGADQLHPDVPSKW